jgi:soluble lytic murein transglycosylase
MGASLVAAYGKRVVFILASLVVILGSVRSHAQVKTRQLADGTTMIYNESPTQRQRRMSHRLLPVPDPGMASLIRQHALQAGLDPRLVQAVVQVESGYNPRALSRKGAMGLMQLMPDTAKLMQVKDPWNVDENIRGGTTYLRQVLDDFGGQLNLGLAAYNAGPTAVDRHNGVPPYPETRNYIERVLTLYRNAGGVEVQAAAPRPTRKIYVRRDSKNGIVITSGRSN